MNVIQLFTRRKLVMFFAIFAVAMLFIPMAKSRVKPYYKGGAVNYNNHIYIGTTNTGKFEIFGLDDGKLYRKSSIMAQDDTNFTDSFFREEGSRLYVYLVNGELSKYDITDPYFPIQVARIRDNSRDKFFGVVKAGDNIATMGTKGLKIWNDNLQVINAYDIKVNNSENLIFSNNGGFIYNFSGSDLEIINANTREVLLNSQMNIADENHNQKPYNDNIDGSVYVVDDSSLRKVGFNGFQDDFKHISHVGYDVATLSNKDYVYFSDGHGVVKMNKSDLEPISWTYTTDMGPRGAWAMGLDIVDSSNGDIVIVFNGSSIVALDKNLDLIDYYASRDQDLSPTEPLSLSADKYRAAPNSYVSLRGVGFGPYEDIEISFSGDIFYSKADEFGKFTKLITVPPVFPRRADIKVDGLRTGLTYSVGFEIE
ncbi:MAG: hypothetical protein PF572_00455 [Patescibacteria group bacterium]|jgi:hypothetical protein|nr:hypothetical protein [Patescibacteria group bacterium]